MAFVTTAAAAPSANAQSARLADSLLQSGALARAESLYYAGVGVRPRDPNARLALGRFLIARGAPRVGATLLEEAIKFGGDRPSIERELAPVYLSIGEYHLLAAFAAVSDAERDRAKWLEAHDTRTIAPDSVVAVVFRSTPDSTKLGQVSVRINGRAVDAAVSARVQGIMISDAHATAFRLHIFPGANGAERGNGLLATADSLAIGGLSIRNVPLTIARLDTQDPVTIGLDVLGKFSPTFDPGAMRMFLRVNGSVPSTLGGERYPTLLGAGVRVLESGHWTEMSSAAVASTLRRHRWTFDAKRGRIVVER